MSEDSRNDQNQGSGYGHDLQAGQQDGRPAQQLPPAGWYSDPHPQGIGQRYWDGARWTHSTRPDPATAAGVAGPAEAAPTAPVQQAQPQPGYPQGRPGQVQPQPGYPQAQPGYPQGQPGQVQPQPDYGQGGYPYVGGYQQPWRTEAGFAYPSGPVTADGVRLGGWGARFVAWIIDGILLVVIQTIVLQLFFRDIVTAMMQWQQDVISAFNNGSTDVPSPLDAVYGVTTQWYVFQVVVLIIGFVYFLLLTHYRGATLGQQALGLRVVPVDRGRVPAGLPWGPSLIRIGVLWVGRVIGLLPVIGFLGNLVQLADVIYGLANKKRQTLHCRFSGTQVISTRP